MTEFFRSTAIPHLEARRSCQENSCYRPHSHEALSLGAIDAGRSAFAGPLSGAVELAPGDVIVIPAGHVHQCNPVDGSWRYRMVHGDQAWAETLLGPRAAATLVSGVTVFRRASLHRSVTAWTERIHRDEPAERIADGFREVARELAAAVPAHRVIPTTDVELRARIDPVLRRLREEERFAGLAELARDAGMSRYELVRAVKRATGLAPLAWRQNARIGRARQLLRSGHPISDTAHELGFTDQSHFHRVFRAHVAASPGAYRG